MDAATPDIPVGPNATPEPGKDSTVAMLSSFGEHTVMETPEEAQKRKQEEGRQNFLEKLNELPLEVRKNFLDVKVPGPTPVPAPLPTELNVNTTTTDASAKEQAGVLGTNEVDTLSDLASTDMEPVPTPSPAGLHTEPVGNNTNPAAAESAIASAQQGGTVATGMDTGETLQSEEPEKNPEPQADVSAITGQPASETDAINNSKSLEEALVDTNQSEKHEEAKSASEVKLEVVVTETEQPATAETLEKKNKRIMQEIKEQGKEGMFYVTVGTGDHEAIIFPVAIITPGKFSNKDVLLLASEQGIAEIDLHNHAVNPFIRDPLTLTEERKQMDEDQLEAIESAIEKYNKPKPPKEHLKEGIFRENGRLRLRLFNPESSLFNKFVDFDIDSEIPDPTKLQKAIVESKKLHASTRESIQDKQIKEFLRKKAENADKALKVF
jgi:hypothetical protein